MKILRYIFVLSLLSFFSNCAAQTGKKGISEFIQYSVDSIYKKDDLPGILVGLLNNGEKQYFTAGFADPEKQMQFDHETVFEIGSITKTFTAYVLMAVLMENKIPETASILKYLPDTVKQNANLHRITFLSLMNHTSGLPKLPDNLQIQMTLQPYKAYGSAELFSYLKHCIPKPDGKSNYSNLGAGLAGVLAEQISGKSYSSLLDQYIFLPFNLGGQLTSLPENKSQGYFDKAEKAEYWNMNVLSPAGGIRSSANQMLLYLQNMSLQQAASKPVIEKLITQTISINSRVGVGLGWHILSEKELPPVYWHNGGTYGFSTFCAFTKDKRKGVIVVVNQFNKNTSSDGLGIKIIKRLLSEE